MLGVAWCRNDERKLFEQFPEVLMLDVTFGTNAETRPLGLTASVSAGAELHDVARGTTSSSLCIFQKNYA